ncbi:DUF4192 family protein, partial [Angustibacter peucedani]
GLQDLALRDAVAQRHCGWLQALAAGEGGEPVVVPDDPGSDPVTAVLTDLATAVDGDWAVPPLTLLALQHWHAGDGALANACVDRALAIDPGYRMALLADQLLRAGVAPSWVDRSRGG